MSTAIIVLKVLGVIVAGLAAVIAIAALLIFAVKRGRKTIRNWNKDETEDGAKHDADEPAKKGAGRWLHWLNLSLLIVILIGLSGVSALSLRNLHHANIIEFSISGSEKNPDKGVIPRLKVQKAMIEAIDAKVKAIGTPAKTELVNPSPVAEPDKCAKCQPQVEKIDDHYYDSCKNKTPWVYYHGKCIGADFCSKECAPASPQLQDPPIPTCHKLENPEQCLPTAN